MPANFDFAKTLDQNLQDLLVQEKTRLEKEAGIQPETNSHFHRPFEKPFTADQRAETTILIGGLTWKHEQLMKVVFERAGYRCQTLPSSDLEYYHIGREYGNNGQCNPTYFTVGSLIHFLQRLESEGLPRQTIIDRYVFLTAGTCGPCRFGMYESEYRMALRKAGFEEFRVLLYQQDQGIHPTENEPGLKYTPDFGFGIFNAFNFGDILHDLVYLIRPYEMTPGETDLVLATCMLELSEFLRDRTPLEVLEILPPWILARVANNPVLKTILRVSAKYYDHLYGKARRDVLAACKERFNAIRVDRTRVKPIVKITGEFWAQTTEGDGNFRMFSFLEQEGAEVHVEPIATWLVYLLHQARTRLVDRKGLDDPYPKPHGWEFGKHLANTFHLQKRLLMFSLGERIYASQYRRVVKALGGLAHVLVSQQELARLAAPYYHYLARGGEGHLEVAKNIYYTVNKHCHMVLSLKPFGCMPSSQSDGVQSAVTQHFKDMIFLPIETSGEGQINAYSRVQMALGEAKNKARMEMDTVLKAGGKTLEDIRSYVEQHPELQRPFYPVPAHPGLVGVAANFAKHVSGLMDRRAFFPFMTRKRRSGERAGSSHSV